MAIQFICVSLLLWLMVIYDGPKWRSEFLNFFVTTINSLETRLRTRRTYCLFHVCIYTEDNVNEA